MNDIGVESSQGSHESQERVRFANKIFFHTTLLQNVPSLIEHGLVSKENRDILGKDLLYSLTFGKEFNALPGQRINSQESTNQFTLTIWKDSSDIKQVEEYGKLNKGQYGPTQRLSSDEEVPEEFWRSNMAGRYNDPEKLRKVGSDNFLAAIPITQDLEETIVYCKLLVTARSRGPELINDLLTRTLRDKVKGIILKPGYSIEDLSKDLIMRMQQEALLYQTGPMVAESLENLKDSSNPDQSLIKATIGELKAKQSIIQDSVAQRYLGILEKRLRQALEQKGLKDEFDQVESAKITNASLVSKKVKPYELWGGSDGYKLVRQKGHQLGLSL